MPIGDSEWRRRIIEQIFESVNRQNYERMGWDFNWKNPPWMNPRADSTRQSFGRGPVYAAIEERMRARGGARFVHLLRHVFQTHEPIRAFFAEADRRLRERREAAAAEVRRVREEAEQERAREAVPGEQREAFAWVKAQAKLAEVTGLEWLRPWGIGENPAWKKAAAKQEALRPQPAPPIGGPFVMGFDPGDERGDRAAYVFGHFVGGTFYLDHTGIVGDGL